MTQTATQTFVVADPRQFDGDPFEVAERACLQAAAVADVLEAAIQSAELMARNAEMTRNLQETKDDARAAEWDGGAQHKRFEEALSHAADVGRALNQLSKAAGFNPKAPLPKEA